LWSYFPLYAFTLIVKCVESAEHCRVVMDDYVFNGRRYPVTTEKLISQTAGTDDYQGLLHL